MPNFHQEIKNYFEQRTLLKSRGDDLQERILFTVRTEILPIIKRTWKEKGLDSRLASYAPSLAETQDGSYSLGFEISSDKVELYEPINRELQEVYAKIKEDYGIEVGGFRPVFRFS